MTGSTTGFEIEFNTKTKIIKKRKIIEYFLRNLDENIFDIIKIVTKKYHQKKYLNNLKKDFPKHKIEFVVSGKTRQESSKKGVYALKKYNPQNFAGIGITNQRETTLIWHKKNNSQYIMP